MLDLYKTLSAAKKQLDSQKITGELVIYCLYCQAIHPPVPDDCKLKQELEMMEGMKSD